MEDNIRSVIIEDEFNSLMTLQTLLEKYCPQVNVTATAGNVVDGIELINNVQPELVFLDIALPDGDGFEILEKVDYKLFDLIFTTAYDQYALKAFEFSAIHYLLKPINFKDLQEAVSRVRKISSEEEFKTRMKVLQDNLSEQQTKIILPTLEGLHVINIDEIIRCESDNNYTIFHLTNKNRLVVSKSLNNFEKLLADKNFVRIHSRHLINMNYLKKYVKGRGGYVVLEDGSQADVSTSRVKDFLNSLKKVAKFLNNN